MMENVISSQERVQTLDFTIEILISLSICLISQRPSYLSNLIRQLARDGVFMDKMNKINGRIFFLAFFFLSIFFSFVQAHEKVSTKVAIWSLEINGVS